MWGQESHENAKCWCSRKKYNGCISTVEDVTVEKIVSFKYFMRKSTRFNVSNLPQFKTAQCPNPFFSDVWAFDH